MTKSILVILLVLAFCRTAASADKFTCSTAATCDARCEKKDTDACLAAATLHSHTQQIDAADHALEIACRANRSVACQLLLESADADGRSFEARDPVLAREIAMLGCAGKNRFSCHELAAFPIPADELAASVATARTGCDDNNADACVDLAVLVETNSSVEKSVPYNAAERACTLDAAACLHIGDLAASRQSIPRQLDANHFYALAKSRLITACDRNEFANCFALGALLERPQTGITDLAASRATVRKACAGGIDGACRFLADSTDDKAEARRLLAQLCDHTGAQQAEACNKLGLVSQLGASGAAKSLATALLSFKKACALKNADGCSSTSHLYEDGGPGIKRSKKDALMWMLKACTINGEGDTTCTAANVLRDELRHDQ